MVINNSVFGYSLEFLEEENIVMEGFIENNNEVIKEINERFSENGSEVQTFGNLIRVKGRESSSISDFLTSEITGHEEQRHSSFEEESSSPPSMGWRLQKKEEEVPDCTNTNGASDDGKNLDLDNRKLEKQGSSVSEIEMMKERFAKLLLVEDISGCGNGVCTALAISNAITKLNYVLPCLANYGG